MFQIDKIFCTMGHAETANQRSLLRRQVRAARQTLSATEQRCAADAVLAQLSSLSCFRDAKHVGLYLANDGELDPAPIVQSLWQRNVHTYLPVLHPFSKGHLLMLRYHADSLLINNRFGIPEPALDVTQVCPLSQLDLLLCPLVAFDASGNRLGMGGGFYDRTLAHSGNKPVPIGLAHSCQQLPEIPCEHWDIPLPAIVTPEQVWRWDPTIS